MVKGQAEPYSGRADQVIGSPPPSSLRYVEEEDPEWRDLDYDLEVGHPPQTFCQFYLQHDCGVFDSSEMTAQVFFYAFWCQKHFQPLYPIPRTQVFEEVGLQLNYTLDSRGKKEPSGSIQSLEVQEEKKIPHCCQ